MGLLQDGKWVDQWYDTKSTGGKFVRQDSAYSDLIDSKRFPAVADRYHLYISYACPWAHRTAIFRVLKGLETIIPMTVVDPHMGENGWEVHKDGIKYLYEVYLKANPNYTGRVTVPVLWDKVEQTIVNNESSQIIRIFNSAFNHLTNNQADYYPKELQSKIDEINPFVYDNINNGVYKAGFATEQSIYEAEVIKLFQSLDKLEKVLNNQRYLVSNTITEADWRLFTTLVRFDPVYVGHFKCNIRRIADYPNLSNYLRDLYQVPGVSSTVNMQHIKTHYYTSQPTINPNGIIALGPELDYSMPHDRDRF